MLLSAGIVTIFFAGLGCVIWPYIQKRCGLTTRKVLIIHSLMYSLNTLYVLLFFNSVYEMFAVAAYMGMLLGATSSSNRVLFSHLIPHGLESEFFGLYAITDKGSAWFGPLVVGAIRDATGHLKNALYFMFIFLIIPAFIFYFIDEEQGKRDALKFSIEDEGQNNIEIQLY
jgi:UMF1 family MFS transporter